MTTCKYEQDTLTCPKDPMNCQCILDGTFEKSIMSYHITQEKAEKEAYENGLVRSDDGEAHYVLVKDLAAYANAVLDRVLGEPVYQAWQELPCNWIDISKETYENVALTQKRIVYEPKEMP